MIVGYNLKLLSIKIELTLSNEDGSTYYVGPDGRIKDVFWSDWKGANGNKYARQYLSGMIGFAAGDVDTNTLNSNLVQALKNGRDLDAYMIWASSYSDEKQEIGFITEGLRELASSFGVEPIKLDNVLADQMKSTVNKVMEADSLDSVLDPSGQHKARQMAGAFITYTTVQRILVQQLQKRKALLEQHLMRCLV